MPIYTVEINGRGIAAFDAVDLVAALDWAHGTVFQEDLFRLETDVRPALPEEEAKWQASWARALMRGDVALVTGVFLRFTLVLPLAFLFYRHYASQSE